MGDKKTSLRVDSELWKMAKIQAVKNDETVREFVNKAIKHELERAL